MKKLIAVCLVLLVVSTSCARMPEGNETSIGHIDKLIYSCIDKANPSFGDITKVIGRHGEITVYGTVSLRPYPSDWWAYVDHTIGTVRFICNRTRGITTLTYQIYEENS